MTLQALIPMQPVENVSASIVFYEKLGFAVDEFREDWGWAMLRCGECRLMLDRSILQHPGIPKVSVLYLYPDDIVAFHQRARANGLTIPDLETTFYGMLEFRVDDPDGNRLWIGQTTASNASQDA